MAGSSHIPGSAGVARLTVCLVLLGLVGCSHGYDSAAAMIEKATGSDFCTNPANVNPPDLGATSEVACASGSEFGMTAFMFKSKNEARGAESQQCSYYAGLTALHPEIYSGYRILQGNNWMIQLLASNTTSGTTAAYDKIAETFKSDDSCGNM